MFCGQFLKPSIQLAIIEVEELYYKMFPTPNLPLWVCRERKGFV